MEIEKKRKAKQRSWEEKKLLCEQWKASGKSKQEFCKENDIPIASFFPWCNKLWPKLKKQEINLSPVKIVNKSSRSSDSQLTQTEIELHLGSGSIIRFKLPIKNLVTFIQELSHAVATIR